MRDNFPSWPQSFITDLNDLAENETSVRMSVSAKNIDRLKDLPIDHLWLIGANDKELGKILPMVRLRHLDLYQVLAKDLTVLETLDIAQTIILNWNSKATSLWDVSKNSTLKNLEITDFSKLENIDQLTLATQVESLTLGGGLGKPMKIKTIRSLNNLTNLKHLCLMNLRVEDDTLKPLGNLTQLELLEITNQFETKEFAWLATRLKNTRCNMFQAVNPCNIEGPDRRLQWDTMVTGRKKPFLLSTKDQVRIDKYVKEFERLKTEFVGQD